jgi:hypothetical protein
MEGQPQHALLEEGGHRLAASIEERLRQNIPIGIDDADRTGALDDEDAATTIVGRSDIDRLGEVRRHLDELDLGITGEISSWLCNLRGIKRVLAR